jgi:hypothetical protein
VKRPAVIALSVGLLVAAAFYALQRSARPERDTAATGADSTWYHASDVAQLATTGRPQLVEFFHPG